MTLLLYADK